MALTELPHIRRILFMIYAFCSDSSFAGIGYGSLVSHEELNNSRLGILTDQMVNYFYTPTTIKDPRSSDTRNERLTCIQLTNTTSRPAGQLALQFDNTRVDDYTMRLNPLSVDDQEAVDILTNADNTAVLKCFFNIIEETMIYHTTAAAPSKEALEAILVAGTAIYGGYVPNSLNVSASARSSKIKVTANNTAGYIDTDTEYMFYTSVSFAFEVDAEHTLNVKIWLEREAFLSEYPYSNLTNVIWPCEPAQFLTMSFADKVEAITDTQSYKDAQLDEPIVKKDHSGLVTYKTRYLNSAYTQPYTMPITVLYKGVQPSSDDVRIYIQNQLLLLTGPDGTPLADRATWMTIFPELFIDAGFYIFPMYIQRRTLMEGVVIDHGILNYNYMVTKLRELGSWLTDLEATITHAVVLRAPGSDIFMMTVPSAGNDSAYMDLANIHPTYMPIGPTGDGAAYYNHMTPDTKAFADALSYAIKVALGLQQNTGEFTEETISGKKFLAFAAGGAMYHLLKKESYWSTTPSLR